MSYIKFKLGNSFHMIKWAALISALMAATMGGVVRVTGSGLGCPDWPLCYGQIIPPMDITAWIEYIHRLSGALAGVFILFLFASGLARYSMQDMILKLIVFTPIIVIVQGLFGAYTVLTEISPMVALIHTGIATALVGLLAIIVALSYDYHDAKLGEGVMDWVGSYWRIILWLLFLTYVLILSGAYVTRTGSSLACQAIPLCGVPFADMAEIQWNHMIHRVFAFIVFIFAFVVLFRAWQIKYVPINKIARAMMYVLSVQILLGIGNVVMGLPAELRALHLTTAAVFFAVSSSLVGVLWGIKMYNLDDVPISDSERHK